MDNVMMENYATTLFVYSTQNKKKVTMMKKDV